MYMLCFVSLVFPLLSEDVTANWPTWRGPHLNGTSNSTRPPLNWTPSTHVIWKVQIPGRGHSSPIIVGNRVFLTSADETAQTQSLLAIDKTTGKSLWNRLVHKGGFLKKHPKNTHASATPACDGERVYTAFVHNNGLHVTALDLMGTVQWSKQAGPYVSEHGYGSSPALFESLVIVQSDSLKDSFLAALDGRSGNIVWKVERKVTGRHGSYATPIVAHVAGKPQLLVTGTGLVTSYDPRSGKLLWSCSGPAEVTACTPAWNDSLVFASGGFPEKEMLAIRADGDGDVTKTHVAWRTGKGTTYVPSPIYHAGRLYVVSDNGIVSCFEASTGNALYQERIAGAFSSSPIVAGERLYTTNEAGKTYVLKTGDQLKVLATNDLADGGFATPAVLGNRLFIRTNQHLYCLGE